MRGNGVRPPARLRAMKVAVIGASRGVGRHIAEQALARGHEVTAAVRNPADVTTAARAPLGRQPVTPSTRAAVSAVIRGAGRRVLRARHRFPRSDHAVLVGGAERARRHAPARRAPAACSCRTSVWRDETASDLISLLMLVLVRRVIRHTLADHRRALEALISSDLEWIAVRPMALDRRPADRTLSHRCRRTAP